MRGRFIPADGGEPNHATVALDGRTAPLSGLRPIPPDGTGPLIADLDGVDARPVVQLLVSSAGFTTGSLQPPHQGVVSAGPWNGKGSRAVGAGPLVVGAPTRS